jgi:hypothetical protein
MGRVLNLISLIGVVGFLAAAVFMTTRHSIYG